MIPIINTSLSVIYILLSTFIFVVYLLNVFKKRSVFEKLNCLKWYGKSQRNNCSLSLFYAFVLSILSLMSDPRFVYGLSLAAIITTITVVLALIVLMIGVVSEWLKQIPET